MLTELSRLEKQCCKENFQYYDKEKLGYVERFELKNILSGKYLSIFHLTQISDHYSLRLQPRRQQDCAIREILRRKGS